LAGKLVIIVADSELYQNGRTSHFDSVLKFSSFVEQLPLSAQMFVSKNSHNVIYVESFTDSKHSYKSGSFSYEHPTNASIITLQLQSNIRSATATAEMYSVPPEKSAFWVCNQYKGEGEKCGNLNDIKDKRCDNCKMRRDKGDLACNGRMRVIGKLKKVEGIVEFWEYIDVDV
jgi:hypothetical protein